MSAFVGLLFFIGAWFYFSKSSYAYNAPLSCVGILIVTWLGQNFSENYLNPQTQQSLSLRQTQGSTKDSSWSRVGTKALGLYSTFAIIALLYWLLPEYRGSFYVAYWDLIRLLALPISLISIPYLWMVDQRMKAPKDSLWIVGNLIFQFLATANLKQLALSIQNEQAILKQYFLGWLVKAFFFPLMFVYFTRDFQRALSFPAGPQASFLEYFDFFYSFLYMIDVGIVSMGYAASLKLFDTHIRSTEPTFRGWIVALVCYEPFWSLVSPLYIVYSQGPSWKSWLANHPTWLALWGSCILFLLVIYVWASVSFGSRFSNLTHRGIITNGPYRWLKHPAYVSKYLSWWMISMPFLISTSASQSIRNSLMLGLLGFIYYLRAKTEEAHLLADPIYQDYSKWIDHNGLWAKIRARIQNK